MEPENKAPAYQWYARDFAADEAVQLMTLEEEGAYRRLLDHQWLHGSIPADVKAIAAICKNASTKRMKAMWQAISPCFHPAADGTARLQNRRMERDRIKAQEYRDRQSGRGKAGGEERWRRERERTASAGDTDSASNAQAIAQASPRQSSSNTNAVAERWPDDSSAVCSLQFASASALKTPPSPSARDENFVAIAERIPPEYQADLAALIDRVPSPVAWLAEIGASLDGMGGHKSVTGEQAGRAARDFNANGKEPNLRLFRRFLEGASEPPRQPRPNSKERQPPGQYEYTPTTEPVTVQ